MFALYLILSEFNKQWQSTIDAKAAAEVKLAAELTASAQKYVSYVWLVLFTFADTVLD